MTWLVLRAREADVASTAAVSTRRGAHNVGGARTLVLAADAAILSSVVVPNGCCCTGAFEVGVFNFINFQHIDPTLRLAPLSAWLLLS